MLDKNGTDVGANDFRISDMGPNGSTAHYGYVPVVTYNPTKHEYLVAWSGDDVDGEVEVYGQRLAAGGNGIGENDFRLSDMGPDGDTSFGALRAAVATNLDGTEYLVVWSGDDDTGGLVDDEYEIFGQRYTVTTWYALFLPIVRRV